MTKIKGTRPIFRDEMQRPTLLAALFGLLLIVAEPAPSTAQIWKNVRVELIDGSSLKGSIASIDTRGNVEGTGFGQAFNLDQVTSISTSTPSRVMTDQSVLLHLVDGGTLYGSRIVIDEQGCQIRSASGVNAVHLENLRAVVWHDSATTRDLIANPATNKDKVVVATEAGQRVVEGVLESVSPEKVKIVYNGKSRSISFGKVKIESIVVADLELERPRGLVAKVQLSDGSSVHGVVDYADSEVFVLKTTGGNSIRIPCESVSQISIQSSSIAFLSSLTPQQVDQSVQFTLQRTWQRNRSVGGNPLSIRFSGSNKVARFENGLGTQAYTRLVFLNEGGFDRFRATVGIDAETEGRGDCRMSVVGDGINLWEKRVRGTDDPLPISVDISGMRMVELIVRPGEQFDLADHANWCEARFTKSK